jgi:hypothetical protein
MRHSVNKKSEKCALASQGWSRLDQGGIARSGVLFASLEIKGRSPYGAVERRQNKIKEEIGIVWSLYSLSPDIGFPEMWTVSGYTTPG